jgi:hypothetical protein
MRCSADVLADAELGELVLVASRSMGDVRG